MSQQYRCRPAELAGVDDPYAAYCFDEAVYLFGNYVDAELHRVSEKAKDDKSRQRKRMEMLSILLREDDDPVVLTPGQVAPRRSTNHNVATLDPDDPVSAETAAKLPPAVKFTGRKYKDPAELFKSKT